ncbi:MULTISPECIES: GNAT family N-acetyltransferase [unclassified Ketobacter]|uniref:GNAT family N-acetyltransferase n=1 Tax=unclassified Ketobacter TaxID=2639109 RepID=UPI000F1892AE|nr:MULTISPECIES: GNAT family N-acetyltransferase [unclassified Ketobacter]MCK5792485.1 GNAT family N-acetyltransferase [Ketobacter sp.]MEC8813854.1 GNAT family N-acetyltransferase [Pseudomonadota bacterium]RLT87828.1 MAG: GNAT family N-acetyltransferase [Ketobacter sp. GenoA1]RLT96508.1 MAG: GNAT family N-acetyltransferase [Ketobacter sp.]
MVELDRYTVSIEAFEAAEILPLWQQLEHRVKPHFFLSACWVSVWVEVFQPEVQVVRIHCDHQLIGLGLLTCRKQVRHGVLSSRVLRLGQTGIPSQDQIWIEYNDLLLEPEHAQQAPAAFMRFLMQRRDWDEVQLGAILEGRARYFTLPALHSVVQWSAPLYRVDLLAIRRRQSRYLDTLSRNTRYQINRSERLYSGRGKLVFSVARSAEEILPLWQRLGALHTARWGEGPGQSGFANPDFVQFHRALINKGCGQNRVEFCLLWLDDEPIGMLYNFVYRKRVYFYLSGISYEEDARCKPGLVLHARAIQHYLDAGYDCYDFMGGEARYKQSLGQPGGQLQQISLQRPRLALKLEQLGRKIKSWVQ